MMTLFSHKPSMPHAWRNWRVLAAAGAALMNACGDPPPIVTFLAVEGGLRGEHASVRPWLEMSSCTRGEETSNRHAVCTIERLYADGAVYVTAGDPPSAWGYLGKIDSLRAAQVEQTLTNACAIDGAPPTSASDGGTVLYRWSNAMCDRQVTVGGADYGPFESLRALWTTITQSLRPVTPPLPPESQGMVRFGTLQAQPIHDSGALLTALQPTLPAVQACYRAALGDHQPYLAGEMTLHVSVSNGTVDEVTVSTQRLFGDRSAMTGRQDVQSPHENMRPCVLEAIRTGSFDKSFTGTVEVPLVFE